MRGPCAEPGLPWARWADPCPKSMTLSVWLPPPYSSPQPHIPREEVGLDPRGKFGGFGHIVSASRSRCHKFSATASIKWKILHQVEVHSMLDSENKHPSGISSFLSLGWPWSALTDRMWPGGHWPVWARCLVAPAFSLVARSLRVKALPFWKDMCGD